MSEADIRAIAGTLAELQRSHYVDIDATIANTLTSFGIEREDGKELRADFQHLRYWRKIAERVQSYTLRAVITVMVTGLAGAVCLGIQVMLGK